MRIVKPPSYSNGNEWRYETDWKTVWFGCENISETQTQKYLKGSKSITQQQRVEVCTRQGQRQNDAAHPFPRLWSQLAAAIYQERVPDTLSNMGPQSRCPNWSKSPEIPGLSLANYTKLLQCWSLVDVLQVAKSLTRMQVCKLVVDQMGGQVRYNPYRDYIAAIACSWFCCGVWGWIFFLFYIFMIPFDNAAIMVRCA